MKRFNVGFWGCIEESKDGLFVLAEDALSEIDGLNESENELIVECEKLTNKVNVLYYETDSLVDQRRHLVKKVKSYKSVIIFVFVVTLLDIGMNVYKYLA